MRPIAFPQSPCGRRTLPWVKVSNTRQKFSPKMPRASVSLYPAAIKFTRRGSLGGAPGAAGAMEYEAVQDEIEEEQTQAKNDLIIPRQRR
jgi:hypothetical protein